VIACVNRGVDAQSENGNWMEVEGVISKRYRRPWTFTHFPGAPGRRCWEATLSARSRSIHQVNQNQLVCFPFTTCAIVSRRRMPKMHIHLYAKLLLQKPQGEKFDTSFSKQVPPE
jgi:hypothetical protein